MEQENNIIVFDFDKTLTYRDTILGFYIHCNRNISLMWKLPLFFFFVALKIVKIISLQRLKEAGVQFFLKGKKRGVLSELGKSYAGKIKFNRVYDEHFLPVRYRAKVISASYNEYLEHVFPRTETYGSSLRYENDLVAGLSFHMYGKNKLQALRSCGVKYIDVFYTDSYSDRPLMETSQKIYFVKGDRISQVK